MGHELSLADVAAVNGNGMNNEMWNNPFIYLVWLAVLGGGGLFGNRNGYGDAAVQGALTRSDLFEGFNNQDVNGQLRGITNGLCDGFYAINNSLKDGFYGTQAAVKDGFYETQGAIKDCCCTTNRNIDAVRFDMSKGFCDIAGAIHAEGEATRALINANTMQELRDKLADKDRDLMTANFQLSQFAQNQYLVNEIRPCAKPAYITCSPYTTASFGGCGCGNGFGV
jgi:hypothetical protein